MGAKGSGTRAQVDHEGRGALANVHGGRIGVVLRPIVAVAEEAKEATWQACGRFFNFFMQKEGMINY
jgi:hypothetical protein